MLIITYCHNVCKVILLNLLYIPTFLSSVPGSFGYVLQSSLQRVSPPFRISESSLWLFLCHTTQEKIDCRGRLYPSLVCCQDFYTVYFFIELIGIHFPFLNSRL